MASYGKLDAHDFSALRMILFAGEVFPVKHLRKLVGAIPLATYYNLYGPTETNVCTFYKLTATDIAPEKTEPVPIGRACANMEVFALDDAGNQVTEPGREGELWARGSCVAQGYWGDKEKTAASFVHGPQQLDLHWQARSHDQESRLSNRTWRDRECDSPARGSEGSGGDCRP
jgi:non-ribosomal peptide synthetase component F